MTARWWLRTGLAVARRPDLWWSAVVQVGRLAPRGWWRRWPPLPRPDPAWLRFRIQTYAGDPDAEPEPGELVGWLRWARDWERSIR